jgi:CRP/FNR family cyclic AMP-dependent transcriptional regulator
MPTYERKAREITARHGLQKNEALVQDIAEGLRASASYVMVTEVPARVAKLLLDMTADSSEKVKCSHGTPGFDFKMTQEMIAERVGASRSYVSTLINDWKREGILVGIGRTTCVRKVDRLRKIADAR